ncbi:MAG TPA: hypothetical protein VGM81_08055 [Burkholderiaceae bacterium]|jgi:hypothetical protein
MKTRGAPLRGWRRVLVATLLISLGWATFSLIYARSSVDAAFYFAMTLSLLSGLHSIFFSNCDDTARLRMTLPEIHQSFLTEKTKMAAVDQDNPTAQRLGTALGVLSLLGWAVFIFIKWSS